MNRAEKLLSSWVIREEGAPCTGTIHHTVCMVVSTKGCGVDDSRKAAVKQLASRLPRVFNVRSGESGYELCRILPTLTTINTGALRTRASPPSVRPPAVTCHQPGENRGLARTLLLVMNSNTPSLAMTINLSCLVTFTTSCSGSAYTPTVSPIESPRLLFYSIFRL